MGRFKHLLFFLLFLSVNLYSQCPDLPPNVQANGSTATTISICQGDDVDFTVSDPNLPTGTIDWFISTTSGFDPLTGGTLLGSSTITSASECDQCPELEAIYIDACGPGDEERNEFMVISSGSGFAVDNLIVDFDAANNFGGPLNADIGPGGCAWFEGNSSIYLGCSNLTNAGPGDYIPPNSRVIIQTSRTADVMYNLADLCLGDDCIFVIRNNCDRLAGAFSNATSGSQSLNRTQGIELTGCCSDFITYNVDDPVFDGLVGNGSYCVPGPMYFNNGCDNGPSLGPINEFNFSASTTPFTYTPSPTECNIPQYIVGALSSTQYNEACCGATDIFTNEYEVTVSCASAELSQDDDGILCPGDCETITVTFDGGASPYNLDLNLNTSAPFPFTDIAIPIGSFPLNQAITICYGTGGPPFDPATFTIDVPTLITGNGTLSITSFTDANGCSGTITGAGVSLSFNEAPDIVTPAPLEECAMPNGLAFFILSDLDLIINNGTGLPVLYFSDAAGLIPISTPYETGTTTIFAQVDGTPCDSEIIPIDLIVTANGDIGFVDVSCDTGNGLNTDCTICDDDGVLGEDVTITVIFENSSVVYDFDVQWSNSGGAGTLSSTSTGGVGTVTLNITETTTFDVISVNPDNGCTDLTDLGQTVTINYSLVPQMDDPGSLQGCGNVVLPPITGTMPFPANVGYYSAPNGMSVPLNPGNLILVSTTIYLYAGIPGCSQEIPINITIDGQAQISDPGPIVSCGSYILPPIMGTDINNANYYTETTGGGAILLAGQVITDDVTLFIFDPICGGNEVSFTIDITPGASITTGPDTIVCDSFVIETIQGFDLTTNEAYFSEPDGLGTAIPVGTVFFSDTLIYIYDGSVGCIIEIPFDIKINQIQNPGLDSTVTICQNDPTLYNINMLLAGLAPDTTGRWIEGSTDIITDSTAVDFSTLPVGSYDFTYSIADTICTDTSSLLTINVVGAANAGVDAILDLCSDTTGVNILILLGGADPGGVIIDESMAVVAIDPMDASFTASTPGTTTYNYIAGDPSSSCGADTSIFVVNVGADINAGEDAAIALCGNQDTLLTMLLMNESSIGTFSEVVPSGGLSGNTFSSSLVASGNTYEVLHIVAGAGPCPSDTALLSITVVDSPNAGGDVSSILCDEDNSTLDLSLSINGDPGGTFYLNDVELVSSIVNFTNETGTIVYDYIIGDGAGCPLDTAIVTVFRSRLPSNRLTISNTEFCPGECTEIILPISSNGAQGFDIFYHIEGSEGSVDNRFTTIVDLTPFPTFTLCEGDGLLSDDIVSAGENYQVIIDSIFVDESSFPCSFYFTDTVSFDILSFGESEIIRDACLNEVLPVGTDIYDQTNPSGETTLPGASSNGCDSIVVVDLNFVASVTGEYSNVLCEGGMDNVLGIEYTTDFVGDTILMGASANGCDSLVMINITFTPVLTGLYQNTLCVGNMDNVLGVTYTESFLGDTLLMGASTAGCDSLVTIDIIFEASPTRMIDDVVCDNYTLTINSNTYNISNPTGSEPIANPSGGCDSIIIIDLDFSLMAIDSTISISTCDNTFAITKGGQTFDISNPSGPATQPSATVGCDTSFMVNITFGELNVTTVDMPVGCEVVDSGFVVIDEIIGSAPYSIFNGTETFTVDELPFNVELPVGSGMLQISDGSGCVAIIPYTIESGQNLDTYEITQVGNQLSVIGGAIDSILWSPSESLDCNDCVDPIAQPDETTTYTALVSIDNCEIELAYLFPVESDMPGYILPSVFSPNGDNQNDNFTLFRINGAVGTPVLMEIYDRWGNRMYANQNPNEIINTGWDGTRNGSDVSPGVYVYRIIIQENDETINLYGDLTVVR